MYTRNQGFSDKEICDAIVEKNPTMESCCEGECDCKRLAVLVATGILVIELAIVVLTRNRAAAIAAREAIRKAMESSKQVGRIELERAEANVAQIDSELGSMEVQMRDLLDRMKQAEQNSFGGPSEPIIIRPPEV
jgi:hypothetical protein